MSHQEHFFPERMPAVFTSSKSTVKAKLLGTRSQEILTGQDINLSLTSKLSTSVRPTKVETGYHAWEI